VASVVDQNGDELFPRKWNSDFIDAPVVEKQNQPSVTSEQIEQAIAKASDADAALYILLASSGLRIGKALALRIGPSETSSYFSDAAVTVHTSLWRRREQDPKQLRLLGPLRLQDPLLNAEWAQWFSFWQWHCAKRECNSGSSQRHRYTGLPCFPSLAYNLASKESSARGLDPLVVRPFRRQCDGRLFKTKRRR
jgi:hypothetical protein